MLNEPAGVQLSEAVTLTLGMAAWQLALADAVVLAGQLTVGGSLSLTLTVNEQEAVLPEASVAVQVTVVVPFKKVEPDGGLQLTVAPGQLSVTVAEKLTTAEHWPGSVLVTMLAGQEIVGGVSSTTVTMAVQVSDSS